AFERKISRSRRFSEEVSCNESRRMNPRRDLLYCYGAFYMLFYQEGLSGYAYNHQRFQRTPWLNILCALQFGRDCIFGSQDISAARWIPEAEDAGGFFLRLRV